MRSVFVSVWVYICVWVPERAEGFLSIFEGARHERRIRSELLMQSRTDVCVIGGGFGGLYTALSLADKAKVTVIDPKDRFVFLPMLYELAAGYATLFEVAPRYEDLLGNTNIEFVRGAVTGLDTEQKAVTVMCGSKERHISFSSAVIAVGSRARLDVVPGAEAFALPFYDVNDAFRLQKELLQLERSDKAIIRVTVVGGGYSGVELACNVAARLGSQRTLVTLIHRGETIMEGSAVHNREAGLRALLNYGVSVNTRTSVEEVREDRSVLLRQAKDITYEIPNDLVLWTAGCVPSKFVAALDLLKDARGRITTLDTLQVVDHPNIYALGDAAHVQGYQLPQTAQVAMQQASTVSTNILASLEGRQPTERFQYNSLGEMITLGPQEGSVSSLNGLVTLEGRLASLARRVVYSVRMPTNTQRLTAIVGAGIFPLAQALSDIQRASASSRR